jgi:hypothetical protein
MIFLVADPGGTTGWCIMECDFDSEALPTLIAFGQENGDQFPKYLRNMLKSQPIDQVIYERFRIYKGTIGGSAVPVLKQIGQIEYVCQESKIPFIDQPPSNKVFFEKKLRALGMHQPGNPHACDAIAHALFFAMTESQKRITRTPSWVLLAIEEPSGA